MKRIRIHRALSVLGPLLALGGIAVTCPQDRVVFEAEEELWLRASDAPTLYEDDLVSVWSAAAGDRRDGLVTFDLSSLEGRVVSSAKLVLHATPETGSGYPIRQTAALVPGTARGATWSTFQAAQAPWAVPLDGLRFDLAAHEGDDRYHASSPASPADLERIQAVVAGDGRVTLALRAVDDGADYRQDWDDAHRPRLVVTTAGRVSPCWIASDALPDATQASAYAAPALARQGQCPAGAQWEVGGCGLPPGLALDPGTGVVSGTPEYGGSYPVSFRLVDGAEVLDEREIWLTVEGIVDTRADLDHDGDVDADDEAIFDGLVGGSNPVAPAVADAGIRGGANRSQNYDSVLGDIVPVELDEAAGPGAGDGNWKGYVKFDVSGLGAPSGATLRLETAAGFGAPQPADLRVDVFGLKDGQDGWDETLLTWDDAPANVDDELDLVAAEVYGGGPLGTFTTTGGVDLFASPALDAFLGSEVGSDGLVTLVLVVESDTALDGDYTVFVSHEDPARGPRLTAMSPGSDEADLDGDGDVDEDDRALLLASWTGPLGGAVDRCWGRYVERALDTLIEHGTDVYGSEDTPVLMSVLDLGALGTPDASPPVGDVSDPCPGESLTAQAAGYPMPDECLRTEGRPHHGRLSQGGANLWLDGPTLRALYRVHDETGDPKYASAADAYVRAIYDRAVKANGNPHWGSHSYYDAYAEGSSVDPVHEILIKHPEWGELHRIDSQRVRGNAEGVWNDHVCNKVTGEHNRHDLGHCGLDFAFSGGSFALLFAFLYGETGEPQYLDRADRMLQRHLDFRDPDTGLVPDAPAAQGSRFDGDHMMTSVAGPYVAQLLRAYEVSGLTSFRDAAIGYVLAWDQWAWDAGAGTYWGMLRVDDGAPVTTPPASSGYGAFAPSDHVNVWRTLMYSYEFALAAAQASVHAYHVADPVTQAAERTALLGVAERWAQVIEAALPAQPGSRFGSELRAAMPAVDQTRGTYAENYGRAISFFVNLHHATCDTTCDEAYLQRAKLLAHEAVEKLYHRESGLFRGHPAKDWYSAGDGVGYLLHALLELEALPARWRPAF